MLQQDQNNLKLKAMFSKASAAEVICLRLHETINPNLSKANG